MGYSKYRAKKCEFEGLKFDSKHECQVWQDLLKRQENGEISDLQRQVPFVLLDKVIENGKVVQRATKYLADFVYYENGEKVVADAKGFRTDVYKLKRKMMRALLGIDILEL